MPAYATRPECTLDRHLPLRGRWRRCFLLAFGSALATWVLAELSRCSLYLTPARYRGHPVSGYSGEGRPGTQTFEWGGVRFHFDRGR